MALSFIPFVPTPVQAFAFQGTFDAQQYQLTVVWNVFGRRWFLQCQSIGNAIVFYQPLIGSPDNGDINMLAGYFIASTLVFRVSTQTFEIGP